MKPRGTPLNPGPARAEKPTAARILACGIFLCGILAACSPAPDNAAPRPAKETPPAAAPASVVSIPEEFLSPPPTPTPAPTPKQPVLPKVLFATSDFQVTTQHGIQGIRAGEAVNLVRDEGAEYVVEYRAIQFKKNKSYFAATYVEPARPEPTPFAGEKAPVATRVTPESPLPDESPLSGPVPESDPALVAGQKKVGTLTDSIRALNDQIRSAQDDLDRKSARSSAGEAPSPAETKKASRAIQRLKEKRDELSAQLTEMGKP